LTEFYVYSTDPRRHRVVPEPNLTLNRPAPEMRDVPAPRRARLDRLASEEFDLLVVGGGITGCGIARDAALRGVRVALAEKDDFASGTSSRSSRLVHGGLRYLEHGYLHLVFEASAERRRLLRLAPHLVRPLEFIWPVYVGARVPRWKLTAGLTLYDALSLFRNVGAHRRLSARQIAAREPALRSDGLVGRARYFDAATDDARLTLANAIGAAEAGAVLMNHAAVRELLVEGGAVRGGRIVDALTGDVIPIRARVVVNAAGPWSDELRRLDEGTDASAHAAVRGSKGVHIAVPRAKLGNHGALTVLSPRDGRVMFVLPSEPQTIIGTTDTYTTASPDDVRASTEDVAYLLESANAFFPEARLTQNDVVSAWAGIRPLISDTGTDRADPAGASREHAITRSERGVVTITGGKLTTYRVMAAEVVDTAIAQLDSGRGLDTRITPTRSVPLPGGDLAFIDEAIDAAAQATGDAVLGEPLVRAYGSRWSAVADEIAAPGGSERIVAGLPYTIGEMRYGVHREMACTLADLLVRRTHAAFQTSDHGRSAAPRVLAAVAGHPDFAATDAIEAYEAEVERMFGIEKV
jgi:glycerol-3-phosphate dehydrogenase